MRQLSRYIFRQLFFTVLTVILVLTSIMWLAQSLRYVDFIANKGIPFLLFFEMIFYLLPNLVVIVSPIAVLIGVLFIYNKLISDHELVVMQASGLGSWQLAKPALLISLIFTGVLYFFTAYFLPLSFRQYRDITTSLKEKSLISLVQVGQFNTFGKYTVYARSQDAQGNFLGLLIYDGNQLDKSILFTAEKGIVFNKEEGGRLRLINGTRQEKDLTTGKPSILYFERYVIESKDKSSEEEKGARFARPYERSIGDLLNPKDSLSKPIRLEFRVAAHQRILSPLYALVFGLLGVCGMLLGPFRRKGRAGKMLIICIIASLIEIGTMVFLHTVKYADLMIFLSYGLVLGAISICLLLLTPWGYDRINLSWIWREG